jgi:hypothetical protein
MASIRCRISTISRFPLPPRIADVAPAIAEWRAARQAGRCAAIGALPDVVVAEALGEQGQLRAELIGLHGDADTGLGQGGCVVGDREDSAGAATVGLLERPRIARK